MVNKSKNLENQKKYQKIHKKSKIQGGSPERDTGAAAASAVGVAGWYFPFLIQDCAVHLPNFSIDIFMNVRVLLSLTGLKESLNIFQKACVKKKDWFKPLVVKGENSKGQ